MFIGFCNEISMMFSLKKKKKKTIKGCKGRPFVHSPVVINKKTHKKKKKKKKKSTFKTERELTVLVWSILCYPANMYSRTQQ